MDLENKRGAIEWTIGKLMSIVLLLILLGLVFYGALYGGLNPLVKRMGDTIEQTGALFYRFFGGSDEDVEFNECYVTDVLSLSNGKEFLRDYGIEESKWGEVKISICQNNVCKLEGGGITPYGVMRDQLYDLEKNEIANFPSLGSDLDEQNFDNLLYLELYNLLENINARDYYDSRYTKQFILYGKAVGYGDEDVYAIWQNGIWSVRKGSEEVYFEKINSQVIDNSVLDYFYLQVDETFDDEVYYKETAGAILPGEVYLDSTQFNGEPIGRLWGEDFDNLQLDSIEELNKLKESFRRIKERLLAESIPSPEENAQLADKINGKTLFVNEELFELAVLDEGIDSTLEFSGSNYLVFSIKSSSREYFVLFDSKNKVFANNVALVNQDLENPLGTARLVSFPIILLKKQGQDFVEVGYEGSYKLPREIFERAYYGTIAYNFLRSKCR